MVPFAAGDWDGEIVAARRRFVTGIGAGTTYPDYKPAPFIVSREVEGADVVTVVTEAIFSYCGVKVKIDTDRHLGPERATVRADGEAIGHVTTGEYGSQMLSLGGVGHLTGGSKAEGRATCAALLALCNREPVELDHRRRRDGHRPGRPRRRWSTACAERRMRVGCGSATIGMFAAQWQGLVDEVVVVDDHITGVVSEHQAGKVLGWAPTGIRIKGHRSTPGRYFRVSEPGSGWGGTRLADPLEILGPFEAKQGARPGPDAARWSPPPARNTPTTSSTPTSCPRAATCRRRSLPTVALIAENCEPALCTVLFIGGAGGSLRAGVTANPVRLTRAVQGTRHPAHLRRRAGLRLAGRRHHLHGRRDRACPTAPSATCRRRRWSRRSSSPCPRRLSRARRPRRRRSARSTTSCAPAASTPPPAASCRRAGS